MGRFFRAIGKGLLWLPRHARRAWQAMVVREKALSVIASLLTIGLGVTGVIWKDTHEKLEQVQNTLSQKQSQLQVSSQSLHNANNVLATAATQVNGLFADWCGVSTARRGVG